jgi:signal transduction histidine kinase
MSQLAPRESSLRSVLTALADGIVVVDGDGEVSFVNPAAERLFGRAAADLVGSPLGFPLMAGDRTELDLVRVGGEPVAVEMRCVETSWEGRPAVVASLRDMTERRRAEAAREQLVREQVRRLEAETALRQRDEFLAVLSHELKTPVTRLRLATQHTRRRLAREGAGAASVAEGLETIDRESGHVSRLVGQLLDMLRFEDGSMRLHRVDVDLRDLVARSAEGADPGGGHPIDLRAPGEPVVAAVDPRLIEHVVSTVLGNAVRYSPAGGRIEVVLDRLAPADAAPVARLSVRDHGLGIPDQYRDKLFDRFFQAHSDGYVSGLGIGLYVARRIVELHGGQIVAEFPEDGGTLLVVRLPLA